jgi:hypothetical protein
MYGWVALTNIGMAVCYRFCQCDLLAIATAYRYRAYGLIAGRQKKGLERFALLNGNLRGWNVRGWDVGESRLLHPFSSFPTADRTKVLR